MKMRQMLGGEVSSLREAIAEAMRIAAESGAISLHKWLKEGGDKKATDAILSAIDSHIPEKRVDEDAMHFTGITLIDPEIKGFNEAVDLMREEVK
jgi:hypothetical protein